MRKYLSTNVKFKWKVSVTTVANQFTTVSKDVEFFLQDLSVRGP